MRKLLFNYGMAIKEDERRLDPNTKKWTGKCTLPTYSGIANKALVFMLADLTLCLKITIAFYLTAQKIRRN